MEYISYFIFDFILIFIIYYFFCIRKTSRNTKMPSEVQYLIAVYKLDINKFSYRKFVYVVGIITSIDISLVATIVTKVDKMFWQILIGFLVVVPVVILSFMFLGKFYQKKETKDNSKELEKEKKYLEKREKKDKKKKNKRKNQKRKNKEKKRGE